MSEALASRKDRGGLHLVEHLDAVKISDLRDVYAFWSGGEPPDLPKREIVRQLADVMGDEGTVYRRVRTLTRKVLDVLLLLLRRADYRSDLPGLFRRAAGEEQTALEYHEAEAALKALARRGFVAESVERNNGTQGRPLFAVPVELGDLLTTLFREDTRTVRSVFSLAGFAAALGATERRALGQRFPGLAVEPAPDDAAVILGGLGGPGRVAAVEPAELRALSTRALRSEGGILLRADLAAREGAAWDRRESAKRLEAAGAGTVARLSLGDYGISCDDEALVVFHEVFEDVLRREAKSAADDSSDGAPAADEILRPGGDLIADLSAFLSEVRRAPVRVTREGEVHRAAQRRIEEGFVFPENAVASRADVWKEIRAAADHLGLIGIDRDGYLACRDEVDRFTALPLFAQVKALYRLALEAAGPRGRSLHLCELRRIVTEMLVEDPTRWWTGDSLFAVARLRYLASLDARRIRDRHRDRHFSAFDAVRESLKDLLGDLNGSWRKTLYLLGMLDVAMKDGNCAAVRLSTLGARVLGVVGAADGNGASGRPLLVTPDFEVVVLPEGDVSDCVHRLGAFAQRVRSGDVVHFRFTRESVEGAAAEGKGVEELLSWLAEHARGPVPGNVATSLRAWASAVTFGTLERGVVLRLPKADALDVVLAVPGMSELLVRRPLADGGPAPRGAEGSAPRRDASRAGRRARRAVASQAQSGTTLDCAAARLGHNAPLRCLPSASS